eukprot:GSMAST32.ASY1.ANO1.1892.1 assembled CDS
MPVVFIAPKGDPQYLKIKANIEEVLARKGQLIIITDEGNDEFKDREGIEFIFHIPKTAQACIIFFEIFFQNTFVPLLAVIPLQVLSYYVADFRGLDVDKPRNLAKSVTVE